MQTFFCSFQKISSMGLEFLIRVVSKIVIFNFEHTGDNAEQVKITENKVGSRESCVVEELPSRKTAIIGKVDGDACQKLLRSI